MEREVLFKGKRTDNKEWVEGFYVCISGEHHYILTGNPIISPREVTIEYYKVIPETVVRFTKLRDKNDVHIFEGDIVRTKYGRLCIIIWFSNNSFTGWDLKPILTQENLDNDPPDEYDLFLPENLEVIGNVHSNPELLKGV